ncbi:PQQ-binding-like beta-propeller repeat protein [Mesotoga sp. BH458_6_3_2_1]|uniref:outer membrane protein assembly factor BamB family protein n=1 Tax=Mesotoga sp. BH458_6_3_2_1 TaxID=1437446 RepID=UPI000EF25C8F|nr:PQQ-binding-like beta-propeller repeat protein [Mesotoga sp. BH458_6_3_2_1]RLL82426.1 hypothetical protein Y697_07720 [Mesotoga sp. BH458_6_3_2_1]
MFSDPVFAFSSRPVSIRFSDDEKTLVSLDHFGTIAKYDLTSRKLLRISKPFGRLDICPGVLFLRNGRLFAAIANIEYILIVDTEEFGIVDRIPYGKEILSLSIDKTGNYLAFVSRGNFLTVISIQDHTGILSDVSCNEVVSAFAFDSFRMSLFAATEEGSIFKFEAGEKKCSLLFRADLGCDLYELEISRSSENLIAAGIGGCLFAIDPATGEEKWSIEEHICDRLLGVSNLGRSVLFVNEAREELISLDLIDGRVLWRNKIDFREIGAIEYEFSSDGERVLIVSDGKFELRDLSNGEILSRFPVIGASTLIAISDSERYVASRHLDNRIMVFDTESGDVFNIENSVEEPVEAMIFEKGTSSLIFSIKNLIYKVRIPTLTIENQLDVGCRVSCMTFQGDHRLFIGTHDGKLLEVNSRSFKLQDEVQSFERCVTYLTCGNGRLFASSIDGQIVIFDIFDFKEMKRISGRMGPIASVSVDSNASFIIAVGWNGRIALFECESGNRLGISESILGVSGECTTFLRRNLRYLFVETCEGAGIFKILSQSMLNRRVIDEPKSPLVCVLEDSHRVHGVFLGKLTVAQVGLVAPDVPGTLSREDYISPSFALSDNVIAVGVLGGGLLIQKVGQDLRSEVEYRPTRLAIEEMTEAFNRRLKIFEKVRLFVVEGELFIMTRPGSDINESNYSLVAVELDYSFLISAEPITFEQYFFLSDEGDDKTNSQDHTSSAKRLSRPKNANWEDAIAYCNYLSELKGLPLAYSRNGELLDGNGNITTHIERVEGYRLPTDAEWELASGYFMAGRNPSTENLWNWCTDAYSPSSAVMFHNPCFQRGYPQRIARRISPPDINDYSIRSALSPFYQDKDICFRVVLTITGPEKQEKARNVVKYSD